MRALTKSLTLLLVIPMLAGCNPDAPRIVAPPPIQDSYGARVGSVSFPTSCAAAVQPYLERALALLHHMTYGGSAKYFRAAMDADPNCAIARWGVAMSWLHPLWPDLTTTEEFVEGRQLLEEAEAIQDQTPREAGYIAALKAYYDAEALPERERLAAYERAWRSVYDGYPDDQEAQAFYALALLATARPGEPGLATRVEAGAIVEALRERVPEHPGALHYIIHSYDTPALANQALPVAYEYGALAPNVAHALHMPTHIFTRVGIWLDSITMNQRSEEAALQANPGKLSPQYLHSLDYEVYARLQSGEDLSAGVAAEHVLTMEGPYVLISPPVAAYALAAIPARYAMERQDWSAGVALQPRMPTSFEWQESFAPYEALTHFARGVSGARGGDLEAAAEALENLNRLREVIRKMDAASYWASQIDVQIQTVEAWIAFAQENTDAALEGMRRAAAIESQTDKHAVTPGEIIPARELLGDMLLALDQPAEALATYEAEFERSPNRFNSLYGAAKAAEQLGDRTTAARYYAQLAENCKSAEIERPRLLEAQAFLANQAKLTAVDT
jgi:tetratricopeptide (TPR) repeat protein